MTTVNDAPGREREYAEDAAELVRRWRLESGFETIEALIRHTHLTPAYLAAVEDGTRRVKKGYLPRIGSAIRAAARRRDLQDRASDSTISRQRPGGPRDGAEERRREMPEWIEQQTKALGRQIAISMWEGCDDPGFINFVINQEGRFREDTEFWTMERLNLALCHALQDFALAVGKRYPIRDQFPYRRILRESQVVA